MKIFVLGELRDLAFPTTCPFCILLSSGETKSHISPQHPLGSMSLGSSVFQGPQPQTSELPASRGGRPPGLRPWVLGFKPPSLCTSRFPPHGRSGHPQHTAGPGRGPGRCGCGTAGEASGLLGVSTLTPAACLLVSRPSPVSTCLLWLLASDREEAADPRRSSSFETEPVPANAPLSLTSSLPPDGLDVAEIALGRPAHGEHLCCGRSLGKQVPREKQGLCLPQTSRAAALPPQHQSWRVTS